MTYLYVVATPIGNLGDISKRAIDTLNNVDLVLCEDTRETKKILQKYSINKSTMSYHAHSTLSKVDKILELLAEGKNLALVSDAGTPGISDPGSVLISKIREHFKNEIKIVPIPGPSAVVSALSASGLPTHEFTFLGFLPHKKGRETIFREIAESKRTFVFYESTHRILKTLESLAVFCPNKKVCIARELTKIYEEFLIDTPENLLNLLKEKKEKQKGEFTIIVSAF